MSTSTHTQALTLSRRDFLRGQMKSDPDVIRPPWSSEETIRARCLPCEKCSDICPEKIIVRGRNGYPQIDFRRGECTFCKECVSACPEPVFTEREVPWNNRVIVLESCFNQVSIYCRSCGDSCQERAIRFQLKTGGKADIIIDENLCTGCGSCQNACPAEAIIIQPEQTDSPTGEVNA